MKDDDDMGLSTLPPIAPDADAKERTRRAALRAFEEANDAETSKSIGLAWVRRALVPAVLVGAVGVYLSWAVTAANVAFGAR